MRINLLFLLGFIAISSNVMATTFTIKASASNNMSKVAAAPYWTGQQVKFVGLDKKNLVTYNTGVHHLRAVYCKINDQCFYVDFEPAKINRLSVGVELEVNADCSVHYKEAIYSLSGTRYEEQTMKGKPKTCAGNL